MDLALINEYISGKKFSNSLRVKTSARERIIPARMESIEKLVKDKNIIHFGCADHIEIIQTKIARNIWFHKRLMNCTNKCVGIDNNKRSVEYLQNDLKVPDVFCLDIVNEDIPLELTQNRFDYLVLGEIIEHIDNPVLFLQTIHEKFIRSVDNIIITAPHAFRWSNFRHVLKHTEIINSDHRYWFTAYTLSKVLYLSGFRNIDYRYVENFKPGKLALRKNVLFRIFPMFRDTVLINAQF